MSKKVFITGATGYIGEYVAQAFKNRGYEVTALVRSDDAEQKIKQYGYKPHSGDLRNPETFKNVVKDFDVIVHAGSTNDAEFGAVDARAVEAIASALKGTNKTFIYTSGSWVLGKAGNVLADETTEPQPIDLVKWRVDVENRVLEYAREGVKSVVVRPTIVYGRRGGIFEQLIQEARKNGEVRYPGTGENYWSIVNIDELAELYVLLAEKAKPGSIYHASDRQALNVKQVADLVAEAAGVKGNVRQIGFDEAQKNLGFIAIAFTIDQKIDSSKARTELGWAQKERKLVEELRADKKALAASR